MYYYNYFYNSSGEKTTQIKQSVNKKIYSKPISGGREIIKNEKVKTSLHLENNQATPQYLAKRKNHRQFLKLIRKRVQYSKQSKTWMPKRTRNNLPRFHLTDLLDNSETWVGISGSFRYSVPRLFLSLSLSIYIYYGACACECVSVCVFVFIFVVWYDIHWFGLWPFAIFKYRK